MVSEAWEIVGPQFQAVLDRGEACWTEAQPLPGNRRGQVETYYVTYSLSPILDDDGAVGGVLFISHDTTAQVLEQRRAGALRELRARSMDARTDREACELATRAATSGPDVPFTAVYLIDEGGHRALCAGASYAERPLSELRPAVELKDSFDRASALFVRLAADRCGGKLIDSGTFLIPGARELAPRAYATPIARGAADPVEGFVLAGVSDEMIFDEPYQQFLERVAIVVQSSVVAARERARERRRAEEIAALDQAKTTLVTNASHELRTPLALILGPLEQTLADPELSPGARDQISLAHKSATRMLRLANDLLDFSRLRTGEQLGPFRPTDLAAMTSGLVAMFTSTAERAGLNLTVDCQPLAEPVYVEPEAWEKIICNLLSNALKFTPAGKVYVTLRRQGDGVVLAVQDTGIGIPNAERGRIFGRFYRVGDARAGSREGSGIGLALTRELVHLHGGSIEAQPSPGGPGTRMVVRIPLGRDHLPQSGISDDPVDTTTGGVVTLMLTEASEWLRVDKHEATPLDTGSADRSPARASAGEPMLRVLVAEDNPDMRAYLTRLLTSHYLVQTAGDGSKALAMAVADPPSIIITDIMMPRIDGLKLLHELRQDARAREIPIMLLSARADPETRREALDLGADDYVVKPFGARELVTRVGAVAYRAQIRADVAEARGRARERSLREAEMHALLDDLKSAQRRVVAAGDAERRRIERDLHDGAQQRLMAIRLELGLLGERFQRDQAAARRQLDRLRGELDEALEELRELAHGLYPPLLASDGLYAALSAAARRAAIPVAVEGEVVRRLPRTIENAAYFCCLEALQNAAKHAGNGARASVTLAVHDGVLEFRVRDDGAGFDPHNVAPGHGLINLNDRLAALAGHTEITSRPGEGTTIVGVIPLP